MARDTLLDFFEDYSKTDDVFLVHDDGYRVRQTSYREVGVAARALAATLADAGVGAGDKVVIWSENRTEWVIALWGGLLARAVLVPVDYRASADLLSRITHIVSSKVVLTGDEVQVPADVVGAVWKLAEIDTDTAQHLRTRNPRTRTSEPQNLRTQRTSSDLQSPLPGTPRVVPGTCCNGRNARRRPAACRRASTPSARRAWRRCG